MLSPIITFEYFNKLYEKTYSICKDSCITNPGRIKWSLNDIVGYNAIVVYFI